MLELTNRSRNPFLRWAGSKRKLLPVLTQYWHDTHRRYVEPFVGSGALFFALTPKSAILSDLNPQLIETYEMVRDHPRAVANRLSSMRKSRRRYEQLRAVDPSKIDSLDRAARFIYLNRYCFNGIFRTNKAGHFNVPYSASSPALLPTESDLKVIAKALARSELYCGDFEQITKRHVKRNDFVYLDPPYAQRNRRVFHQYAPDTFGLSDIERLRTTLREIDRRGALFVMSYGASAYIERAFSEWNIVSKYVQRNIAGFVDARRRARELLVTNMELP